ncbi:extracellular solute-binding protein [Luteipulveratus mongoliensis]|uniref:ABC transporter substrate-binding protein n=1 Tax=Luteipulveratus mongoliensis TaxID=571913 RepID=A0A0K1JLT7_9MICO|nr:extracellular solute-binding protein [Luteipulveratus mongoliensis]AKU17545.1 hypothetical protein VV02_19695 [Luteipulveratus mongoliensis]
MDAVAPAGQPQPRHARLSRRVVLAGGLGGLAAATLTGCGSPVATGLVGAAPPADRLTYWSLFTGGDGDNMKLMQKAYSRSHRNVSLSPSILAWGTPYYTKLALATAGHQPPDVAVVHLSRLQTLAQADLLSDLPAQEMTSEGMPASDFTPAALTKATYDDKLYAVPLDTHPFVMYYNLDICRRAGLLDASGQLKPIEGPTELTAAFRAAQKVTGSYGAVIAVTNDPSTNWRWFATLYYQLGGTVIGDSGATLTLDDDKAAQALSFMQSLTKSGLMPKSIDGPGVTSLFSSGKAGFLLDGEWAMPTYKATPLKFSIVPVPKVFGPKQVAFADSHALVIPKNSAMSHEKRSLALGFIKSLLQSSLTWAQGGHIPAYLPVQQSASFRNLKPQSSYAAAALSAEYDPPGWYSGAGSQFENVVGAAVASSQSVTTTPAAAVRAIRSGLTPYTSAKPPVS